MTVLQFQNSVFTAPVCKSVLSVRQELLQHGLRCCSSVHRYCSALALSSCLLAVPVMAIPAMDDLEIRLQGEAKGWLNATCTYYGMGWLTPDQGRKALKRLMLLLSAHYLDPEETQRAKSAALSRDPQCKTIWP
ncbi:MULTISPECIES: hypothetical protein [unclassified Synechococcus]|uniref:hypothetical protein n=1 Tax=unclassified Synechococcus TaxID=2626047 RepID=UPI0039AFFAF8